MRQLLLPKSYKGERFLILNKEDSNYLSKVLRFKLNYKFKALDFNGKDYTLSIVKIEKNKVIVECENKLDPSLKETQPKILKYPKLSLAVATLKGKKLETIIKAATEIGINNIFIFEGINSVSKNNNKIEKFEKIRNEAIQQSGSRNITKIKYDKLENILNQKANFIALHQEMDLNCDFKNIKEQINPQIETIVFVGPEGGFDKKEIDLFIKNNVILTLLPTNILRSETACIYSISYLSSLLS